MTNEESLTLSKCTINSYISVFSKTPKKEALDANKVYKSLNMSGLKKMYIDLINLTLSNIISYAPNRQIKLLELRANIDEIESTFTEIDLSKFNEYIINTFKINELQLNKELSMLDFYNLEQLAIKTIKNKHK